MDSAQELLTDMRQHQVRPSVVSYTAAVSACRQARDWVRALGLFQEMQESLLRPDVASYNSVIDTCGRTGMWQNALSFLDKMRRNNVKPDVVTYGSLINASEKVHDWERSLALLDEVRLQGLKTDLGCVSLAMSACCKARRWDLSLHLFYGMCFLSLEPDTVAYGVAVQACQLAGKHDLAMEICCEMRERGFPSNSISSEILSRCAERTADLEPSPIQMSLPILHGDMQLGCGNNLDVLSSMGSADVLIAETGLIEESAIDLFGTQAVADADCYGCESDSQLTQKRRLWI